MPLSYKDTSHPYAEPVTLEQAKAQLTVDAGFTADDPLITALITAARQYVEKLMNRAIFNRNMQLFLDFFPFPVYDGTVNPNDRHCLYGYFWHALAIKLPRPCCLSVQSIKYIDLTGTLQTLDPATYFVDVNSEPARIVPQPGVYWPYTQSWLPDSVVISYTAGSYDAQIVDQLPVATSGDLAVYSVTLSQAAAFTAGTLIQTSPVTLVDAAKNPVAFTNNAGVLTVASTYAGQTLTATYYAGSAPQTVKQAILLLVSFWYNHRDAAETQPPQNIAHGVEYLLAGEIFETFGF
jgi:hypothetical protein